MERFFFVSWWWGPLNMDSYFQAASLAEAKDIWEKTIASGHADGVVLESITGSLKDGETEKDRIFWRT